MNRNSSSHFSATDNRINIGRSKFNRDSWCKTSMNVGDLVPFYVDEILPGDTFDMKTSVVARMATPIAPVMDNCYLDTYFFFVPNRLLWEHWKEFNGENNVNAWTNTQEYRVPSYVYNSDEAGIGQFSVGDYMGLPVDTYSIYGYSDGVEIQVLPLRAYHLIWNEWFRDQNLQNPLLINTSDFVDTVEAEQLMTLRKVNKFHDYFTSALPAPQKGAPVLIPGLQDMPVITGSSLNYDPNASAMSFAAVGTSSPAVNSNLATNAAGAVGSSGTASVSTGFVYPSNLFANASADTGATIDALRTAFQIQKLLWRDGNGGTRYTEITRSHFGVVSPDGRLQRPEYLGGKRTPLTMHQVIQQSETASTPLGNVAGISKTVDLYDGFTKSFTEHGYIIGVCCVRADHTYQQGYNRMWSRFNRFDFYYPELANIGEQPIKNKEIMSVGETGFDNEVFGYQEAWAEYRYRPSYVTGAMRSWADSLGVSLPSLGVWNYADTYEGQPKLSAEWIQEPVEFVNRTLAVPGSDNDHEMVFADFYFDLKCTRPMPVYSVPGLVDHF